MTTTEKINNAIKWINGLSETDLPQGTGELGDSKHGFCCLGYGCNALGIDFDPRDGVSNEFKNSVGLLYDTGLFVKNNKDGDFKFKLTGQIKVNDTQTAESLIELNDDTSYEFKDISNFIKSDPYRVFESEVAKGVEDYFNK